MMAYNDGPKLAREVPLQSGQVNLTARVERLSGLLGKGVDILQQLGPEDVVASNSGSSPTCEVASIGSLVDRALRDAELLLKRLAELQEYIGGRL